MSATTPHDPAAFLRIERVTRRFGDFTAVRDLSLDIAAGEFFSLLGGSGCGKSTLLRMLAGLERPDSGRLLIDGTDITDQPAYRRPVNMMFQSYALFPHLNVFNNVAFGLRQARVPAAAVKSRVGDMLDLLELGAFARRRPDQLSGGQRQRVALARALVNQPRILLLDEPLAALDKRLRERTALELARIQRQVGITFVLVTHDQEEAMNLSTRIGVMAAGQLVQVGTPQDIYQRPRNRFVASFVGSVNLFAGVAAGDHQLHCAELGATLQLPPGPALDAGQDHWIAVRPESIALLDAPPVRTNNDNVVAGTLESVVYLGAQSVCHVSTAAGGRAQVTVPRAAFAGHTSLPPTGAQVWLAWSCTDQTVLAE